MGVECQGNCGERGDWAGQGGVFESEWRATRIAPGRAGDPPTEWAAKNGVDRINYLLVNIDLSFALDSFA